MSPRPHNPAPRLALETETTGTPPPALPSGEQAKATEPPHLRATPMMAQYWRIKKQHPDCLLFYRMGDFYELFFEDAEKAASALDIALTQRGSHLGEPVKMCGVPAHSYEPYLAKLIRKGFRIAVCEQTEDPQEARDKRGASALIERAVVRTITPGTLTEDAFLEPRQPCIICAVARTKGRHPRVALAWLDLTATTFFCQQQELETLPSALARIEPREIVLPESLLHTPQLFETFDTKKDALTPLPDNRFDHENAKQFLMRYFQIQSLHAFFEMEDAQIAAAGTLLDYVQLTQGEATPDIQNLVNVKESHAMAMDATTRRTLDLFDTASDRPRATLIATLDECNTALGARLLRERIANPSRDKALLERRLDSIEFFVQHPEETQQATQTLRGCPDGTRALARIALERATPRDLGAVSQTLSRVCRLKTLMESLRQNPRQNHELPQEMARMLDDFGTLDALEQKLSEALLETLPTTPRVGGFLSERFAPELQELRTRRDEALRELGLFEQVTRKTSGIETLKVRQNAVLGTFFEVPLRHAAKMQKNFRHRQNTASVARFSNDALEERARSIATRQEQLIACEMRLYAELLGEVRQQRSTIRCAFDALAVCDLTTSLASQAQRRGYCRPQFADEPVLELIEARHPVLDAIQQEQPTTSAQPLVANDCLCRQDSFFKLITGPNMAGKSTYLRQNALIILMAQCGCFVPAKRCTLSIADRLCSRMGASDDLAGGKSTFMLEMAETAAIVRQATKHSFLILDEIGRGTATYDGLAIAWAVVEHLVQKTEARTLFATHYHELTALDETLSPLETLHMTIIEEKDSIAFPYKVAKGAVGRSYGIEVAKRAGLPQPILARAREILFVLEKNAARQDGTSGFALPAPQQPSFDEALYERAQNLLETLHAIDPDALTPKQALEELYALKKMYAQK